jgi:hypothetical protein
VILLAGRGWVVVVGCWSWAVVFAWLRRVAALVRWPQITAPKAIVIPASWTGVSRWSSTAQPTAVATTGDSRPSSETLAAGIRSRPQNQIVYAAAVPISDR